MINPIGIHKGEVTAHHDIFINPHTFNVDSMKNTVNGVIEIDIRILLLFLSIPIANNNSCLLHTINRPFFRIIIQSKGVDKMLFKSDRPFI